MGKTNQKVDNTMKNLNIALAAILSLLGCGLSSTALAAPHGSGL